MRQMVGARFAAASAVEVAYMFITSGRDEALDPLMLLTSAALLIALTLVAAEIAKSGADILGVGVAELVKDGEGFAPGISGGGGLAGSMVGVAEVGQGVGFVVAVAEITVQSDRALKQAAASRCWPSWWWT